jgi:hypothetical protein
LLLLYNQKKKKWIAQIQIGKFNRKTESISCNTELDAAMKIDDLRQKHGLKPRNFSKKDEIQKKNQNCETAVQNESKKFIPIASSRVTSEFEKLKPMLRPEDNHPLFHIKYAFLQNNVEKIEK